MVNHSQVSPGPPGSNRAGYTKITLKARMNIRWDNLAMQVDGRVPFFARSVNIFFSLVDMEEQLHKIVADFKRDLGQTLKRDSNLQDSPSHYAAVYRQCPSSDW